jgi:hypothetical protein
MTTEPPFPQRQAVRPQRRTATKPAKIINGVTYYGVLSTGKHAAPSVAKHGLTIGHEGPNK